MIKFLIDLAFSLSVLEHFKLKQFAKNSYRYLSIVFLSIFLLFSCSKKVVPGKPESTENEEREYLPFDDDTIYKPVSKTPVSELPKMSSINSISEIHLPLSMDSAALTKQINVLIPKILYEDRDLSDDKMIVVAEKIDGVTVSISPNNFTYTVPFKLHIERDVTLSTIKADGSLRLYFNTDYKILPDWSFETKTTITNHEWIETPKVKVGFLNIPIESIANKIVQRSAEMVCKNIDAQLTESFKLRDYIDQAWRRVQEPIQITDTPVISWLLIKPEKIMMEPLKTIKGNVQTSVIFRSQTDLAFGPKPDLPYAGILPTFEQLTKDGKDSLIELSIRFPLQRAEILLRDYFKGQKFVEGNKVMIIDSVHLSGAGTKLQAEAFISGSYPVRLIFEGVPFYNKNKRRFELNDLKYSLKSKNLLVKAASWILKKNLDKKLGELLVYEVGVYIDEGKQNLIHTLSGISSYGFRMQVEINDVWALDPVIIGEVAEIKFLSNSKFRLMVDEFVGK